MNSKRSSLLFFGLIAIYFLLIAIQIIGSTYLFTDEAWQLWHAAKDHEIVGRWAGMGRMLTGYMEQWMFAWAHTVAGLKWLRLLTWAGWIGCTVMFYQVLRRNGLLDGWTVMVATAYFASTFFTLTFISWAVCVEAFIPTALALVAGVLLYEKRYIPLAIAMGILSLFFYQICYPFVLLPFYCLFLRNKDGRWTRPMIAGVVYFIIGMGLYFILFKYSTPLLGFGPSARTAMATSPLDRISFFFSTPMNQAFNVSCFFNMSSAVSQAVFPVVFAAWLLFEFIYRRRKWTVSLRYVLGLLSWWLLGYLPMLVSTESNAPYRSMPVLGVMVLLMLADIVAALIREGRNKQLLGFAIVVVLLAGGDLVYYRYLAHPLDDEYQAVKTVLTTHYDPAIKKVVFIRTAENGFLLHYGVRPYKDEFGMPSTYKDWTPEPLVKQIIYEATGDRSRAETLEVVTYPSLDNIPDKKVLTEPGVLFIDAHTLF